MTPNEVQQRRVDGVGRVREQTRAGGRVSIDERFGDLPPDEEAAEDPGLVRRAPIRPRHARRKEHGPGGWATHGPGRRVRARPSPGDGLEKFALDARRAARSSPITGTTPTLSLIIPSYNQRERATHAAREAHAFLGRSVDPAVEILLVDDGSRPTEVPAPQDLPSSVVVLRHETNLGKGGAIRTGVLAARGRFVLFTDSDLPFSLEPVATTLAWLADDADIVIGDRLLPDSECAVDVTPLRRLSSVVFTAMVRRWVGLPFDDTQCGYKGYRTEVARRLYEPLQVTSFAFDVEVLVRACKSGYRIRRQPLRLVHNEDTSVRLSRHAPQMLMDMARIGWRARMGRYD